MNEKPNYLNSGGRGPKRFDKPRPEGRRSFLAVMAVFLLIFTAVMVWQGYRMWDAYRNTVGDTRTVESYQFDLSNLTVDRSVVVPSGAPKDVPAAVTNPTLISAAEIAEHVRGFSRLVVPDDIVIGVEINGEARAYPVRYMQWHQIVNDTVGGVPVAVTYHKPCDSAVVFDRRISDSEQTVTFGFSGLLYNSNLLMYDDQATNATESLWSQLKFEAISGPRAGEKLTVVPMYFGPWERWLREHPQTSVWGGEAHYKNHYNKRTILPGYFERGELLFPVKPLPPPPPPDPAPGEPGLKLMDRVVVFEKWVVPADAVTWTDGNLELPPFQTQVTVPKGLRLGEVEVAEDATADIRVSDVSLPASTPFTAHACWFAWYAMHGSDGLIVPAAEQAPGKPGR